MSRAVIIYGLVDPREAETIRYVGKTITSPEERMRMHRYTAKHGERTPRAKWQRKLSALSIVPVPVILAVVPPGSDWTSWEVALISHYRSTGRLLNISDGGDGGVCPRTPEWNLKISLAQKGKKRGPMSPEHRMAIARGNLGNSRPCSTEQRAKISASLIARNANR